MDETSVQEQLRAGSILEAIRIRKVGYGYRISYDDFAAQFWPILGSRVYEADESSAEAIFNAAASLSDPETAAILAAGESQGWKCGVTKLFIKDEARFAIEAALNKLRTLKATMVQATVRRVMAKLRAQKRKKARDIIQDKILAYIQRKRWRDNLMNYAGKFTAIVIRIQQRFRFKRRREQIMAYFRVRKNAVLKIQRAWRRMWAFEKLVKNLNRRREARLFLQRAFRRRMLHKFVFEEIMRRAKRQRELRNDLI